MIRVLSTCLAWSLTTLVAYAQAPSFEVNRPILESTIDQWTTGDGIVSNNLTHVLQSRSGFLWISSFNGMTRFDGQRFELFNKSVVPFLLTDAFYRIYESPDGNLWLASQGSGIVRYVDGSFKAFVPNNKLLPKSIRCLALNPDGTLYAGSNNKGLYFIKDTIVTRIEHEAVKDVSVNSLLRDLDGNVWVGTNGKGLVCMSGSEITQFTSKDGLLSDVVNSLTLGKEGEIIVGTSAGLNMVVKRKRLLVIPFLRDQQITDVKIDQEGSMWAATAIGLARINLARDKFEFHSRNQGLPSLEITSLNFDNEGSLWLTTSKAGLVRLKMSTITTYTTYHGLSTNEVNVVTQAPTGKFYIGSDGGDIDVMEGRNIAPLAIHTNLKNVGIRDIFTDSKGVLWISSYLGVLKKTGDLEKLITTRDGLPAHDIRKTFEDSHGNLWFASRSGGVIKFKNDKVVAHYDRSSGLESNYILAIAEDQFGTIYAATNGGGISRIHTDGSTSTLHLTGDDSGVVVFNFRINRDGSIWVISNIGIFHFDGRSFKKVITNSKTRLGTTFDLCEDNEGGIWVSTNKGILFFTKSDADKFIIGKLDTIPVKQFDEQDGMKNRECTSATQILKSQNGDILVPTLEGVSKINPRQILKNNLVPPVYITHIITDKKDSLVTTSREFVIEPGNLRYVFQFTALSFLAPKKVNFKYQLQGIDPGWVHGGTEREAQYTNLPPGSYSFKVIGSNNDGIWNEVGTEAIIRVRPFFYQTWPFYLLIALILSLALFSIYKWRTRVLEDRNQELKKLNSELDKFVYSASHDLRAPLSSILGLVNVARQEAPENRDLYLNLIEKSIHKLDQFIRDIIDFSRNARLDLVKEQIDFEMMLNGVMDEMKYMDETNKIIRTIKVIGQGPFYSDSRRLVIILNNLVSNAFKYHNPSCENPFIEIRVEQDTQRVKITVSDNGTGIAAEHVNNIFKMFYRATETSKGSGLGLYIVRETVDKLSGQVTVASQPGSGSSFEVVLPSMR